MDKVLEGRASIVDLTTYYVQEINKVVKESSFQKGSKSAVTNTELALSVINSELQTIFYR